MSQDKEIIIGIDLGTTNSLVAHADDKGPVVKRACTVGCIGCTLCVKKCPNEAIQMDNFLAAMDYEKCAHAGVCLTKCPTKTIVLEVRPGEQVLGAPEPEKLQAAELTAE